MNKNRKIYWKHIWKSKKVTRNRTTETKASVPSPHHSREVTTTTKMTTKSLRDHIQWRPPSRYFPVTVKKKRQNRADVETMEMFVFCIRENGSEWKSSLVTPERQITPSHTHTSKRKSANFSHFQPTPQAVDVGVISKLLRSSSWPILRAHIPKRATFGVWLM